MEIVNEEASLLTLFEVDELLQDPFYAELPSVEELESKVRDLRRQLEVSKPSRKPSIQSAEDEQKQDVWRETALAELRRLKELASIVFIKSTVSEYRQSNEMNAKQSKSNIKRFITAAKKAGPEDEPLTREDIQQLIDVCPSSEVQLFVCLDPTGDRYSCEEGEEDSLTVCAGPLLDLVDQEFNATSVDET